MARKSRKRNRLDGQDPTESSPVQGDGSELAAESTSHLLTSSPPLPQPVMGDGSDDFVNQPNAESDDQQDPASCPSAASATDVIQLEALQSLVREFQELKSVVLQHVGPVATQVINDRPDEEARNESDPSDAENQIAELVAEVDRLQQNADDLTQQNKDLASQVAIASVQQSIEGPDAIASGDPAPDLLSWEERKALIYRQMEDETFDAESFIETLQRSESTAVGSQLNADNGAVDPTELVSRLVSELERHEQELANRNDELGELRCILEQRTEIQQLPEADPSQGVAIGAAAIAQMLDSDELIRDERERLQSMQTEWEEKFRQVEITASLERAKLSRERQELAMKNAELEEQLAHLQRASRQGSTNDTKKRRWLAELGLSQD